MDNVPDEKKREVSILGKMAVVIIALTFAALIIILIILSITSVNSQNSAVPLKDCGNRVIQYVNQNLIQTGPSATLISTSEKHGLYESKIQYQSQEITLYATKDCTLLITASYNMTNPNGSVKTGNSQEPPVKSERPSVDLYVMAFCPYGTQAETAMKPVEDLLRSKADIRIRYITKISGSTTDSVSSLHGPTEAQEDLRQICIQHYAPEKFWNYITQFNQQCYPASNNQTTQRSCWMNASIQAGIDSAQIESCTSGKEGLALLMSDEFDANQNGATGSPTLIINGVTYNGARTPEAYKQAICDSFETVPVECNTTLSSSQVAGTNGGC